MPGDEEIEPMTRSMLVKRLAVLRAAAIADGAYQLARMIESLHDDVATAPIVEDVDAESMAIADARFDLSASRDETHVTIVVRLRPECDLEVVLDRVATTFNDMAGSKAGSSAHIRTFR